MADFNILGKDPQDENKKQRLHGTAEGVEVIEHDGSTTIIINDAKVEEEAVERARYRIYTNNPDDVFTVIADRYKSDNGWTKFFLEPSNKPRFVIRGDRVYAISRELIN